MTLPTFLLKVAQLDSDGHMDWGDGWWVMMVIGVLLLGGLLIAGIVWLVRELGDSRQRPREPSQQGALEILDRRLAEGAISPEEYRKRRNIISGEGDNN